MTLGSGADYRPGRLGIREPQISAALRSDALTDGGTRLLRVGRAGLRRCRPRPRSRAHAQRRLGHATAAETLDTYAHLWPDSEDRTRAAIDAVLRPPPTPQLTTPRAATTRRTTDRPHRNHGGPTLG